MSRVFRVQDADGRGPYRPGLSKLWVDAEGPIPPPTWMDDFGWDVFDRLGRPGEHFGSAVSSLDRLDRWFSPSERRKLEALGFRVVEIRDARVIASSERQLVFGRMRPLAEGAIARRWP